MNDRINELIDQATIRGEEYLPGNDGHPTPTVYFDKRNFAELLLQECISQARAQKYNDDEISSEADPLMLKLSLASNVGVESAIEAIQTHFGVK